MCMCVCVLGMGVESTCPNIFEKLVVSIESVSKEAKCRDSIDAMRRETWKRGHREGIAVHRVAQCMRRSRSGLFVCGFVC